MADVQMNWSSYSNMPSSSASDLQSAFDLWQRNQADCKLHFLEHCVERLRKLTCKILHESFPRVAARHELDSVVNETWVRLHRAMDQVNPPTIQDFFRLAAYKIRHVLLDMVRQRQRLFLERDWDASNSCDRAVSTETHDPSRLQAWTEFHERVEHLEQQQRQIFELHFYFDLPQSDIATLLNLHPRQVSRLWIKATDRLIANLDVSLGTEE